MSKKIKQKQSIVRRILKILLSFCFLLVAGVIGAGTIVYFNAVKDLPKLENLEDYQPPVMAEVFAEDGQKIGEFWIEARILTPIERVPKKLIEAFVASEDDRFFEHSGVDVYSIVRAFWRNFQAGHVVEGGSTITQQVTKALLLSPERTYDRKIKEAILATRIEKNLSKEQILYLYLNQIYFGNRAYGVAAAARNYFHKKLEELDIAEMAMIVGLSKGPSKYNPIVNPTRAIARQHYVLNRMFEEGYATKKEIEQAKKKELVIFKSGLDKDFNLKYAPYFVEHVRRYIKDKYGDDKLYKGGWQIYTTLNLDIYKSAQEALSSGLLALDKRYGYRGPLSTLESQQKIDDFLLNQHVDLLDKDDQINYFGFKGIKDVYEKKKTPVKPNHIYQAVVISNTGGGLEVKVGNRLGYISSEHMKVAQYSQGNRIKAGDVVEVELVEPNSKGKENKSTAIGDVLFFQLIQKPDIQGALYSYEPFSGKLRAVIGGYSFEDSEFNRATQALRQPGSTIKPLIYAAALDKGYTPNTVIMDSPIHHPEGNGQFWEPKNYGGRYYGPTLLRNALINSRNVVTVRILMDIGTHYATAYMRKAGFTTPIFKYYSLALGATEVYLEEICRAYGMFDTGGVVPDIYFVKKIVDSQGRTMEEHVEDPSRFIISWSGDEKPPEKRDEEKTNAVDAVTIKHKRSYEEMSFNPTLLEEGDKKTKNDDLHLTEYEKKVLYGDYIPPSHAISPKTAVTMNSLMQDIVHYGTGARARALERPAAGKTGTTNRATDAWFIGFTPSLLTGVWVGFDQKIKSIGRGATGGGIAAPIWVAFMKKAVEHYPVEKFNVPKWIDLSKYQTPIQVVGIGDAELGDIGIGTGVGPSGSGSSSSSATFFSQDLDW